MKGFVEILNVVLMTGLLLGVVAAVFMWGEPLIKKNEGIAVLQNSERFITDMAVDIEGIVNHPGKITLTVPDSPSPEIQLLMAFDAASQRLTLEVDGTLGTLHSTGALVPLGRNGCAADKGTVQDEQHTLCVRSEQIGDMYVTTYTLKFIQQNTESDRSYKIDLAGTSSRGGSGHSIVLENKGAKTELIDGKNVQKAKILVGII